jgi:serine/threonine protein kinase
MAQRSDWQEIRPLGEGGQSRVFLVRSPARSRDREQCIERIVHALPKQNSDAAKDIVCAVWAYARPDSAAELGALKVFKIPSAAAAAEEAMMRLKREIAVLTEPRPGLLRLLDSNEEEQWIVTEYHPAGTLADHPQNYKGMLADALKVFRPLVETVASLHRDGIVHRDIKPQNVFIGVDEQLVLGDFGIVFLPGPERVTTIDERVGPRDYMPQWGDLGSRLENVRCNFDVYMLAKLLWCMVSGRAKLPREYYYREEFDLAKLFNRDPHMHLANEIFEQCLVEEEEECLSSATELLAVVDECLDVLARGGHSIMDNVLRPCRVCGKGSYRPQLDDRYTAGRVTRFLLEDVDVDLFNKDVEKRTSREEITVWLSTCDNCGHVEFFRSPFPGVLCPIVLAKRASRPKVRPASSSGVTQ